MLDIYIGPPEKGSRHDHKEVMHAELLTEGCLTSVELSAVQRMTSVRMYFRQASMHEGAGYPKI